MSRLESLDLKKAYPEANITFETAAGDDSRHGELATAALVVISLAGIKAIAAWLLKNRTGTKIEKKIEIINKDGSKRVEIITIYVTESTTEAEVVNELTKMLDFDLGQVVK